MVFYKFVLDAFHSAGGVCEVEDVQSDSVQMAAFK